MGNDGVGRLASAAVVGCAADDTKVACGLLTREEVARATGGHIATVVSYGPGQSKSAADGQCLYHLADSALQNVTVSVDRRHGRTPLCPP